MRESKVEPCLSCEGLMTIASMKSDNREMISHYRGAWVGLRTDEEGVTSLILACSEVCATKLLNT